MSEDAGLAGEEDERDSADEWWEYERQCGDRSEDTASRKREAFKKKRQRYTDECTESNRRDRQPKTADRRFDHDALSQHLAVIREAPNAISYKRTNNDRCVGINDSVDENDDG